jgi:Flp pilus assembly protein TadD
MSRRWIGCVFAVAAMGQQGPAPKGQDKSQAIPAKATPDAAIPDAAQGDLQLPPDEDKATAQPRQYPFNPLQSKKEATVGEFYFRKSDFRAAAGRFSEATKYNDGNAEAWLRLGDAQEKMRDSKAAREAYTKYLQLAPEAKNAAEVRKKLEKLKD